MSDLSFNQLIRLFPATDVYTYESMPKPRRLLPSLFVGATVAALTFGVGGAWRAAQTHTLGESITHTLGPYESLRAAVQRVCTEQFGDGQIDTQASVDLTHVLRDGVPLNKIGDPIRSGDTAEIQCATYDVPALNERNPFSGVMRFIVPLPESDQ